MIMLLKKYKIKINIQIIESVVVYIKLINDMTPQL